jgi:hypothetical protein
VKVAVVRPPLTVIVAGTRAAVDELVSLMLAPADAAGPLSVIVPLVGVPPATVAGERVIETTEGGVTVRVAVLETLPILAVTVMSFWADTATVVAAKAPALWPGAIATVFGTVASVLLLVSVAVSPLGPAAPLRLTEPWEELPPATVDGWNVTDVNEAGPTLRVAD